MNILTAEHLSKAYSERRLLEDVSFSMQEGDKVGVLGINGTGKTTLLRLLAGREEPDGGSLILANHVIVRYLPQDPVFPPDKTVLEGVMDHREAHVDSWDREGDARTMLNRLGLTDPGQRIGDLSGGQRKRLALAAVLLAPADLLVLDEPTNHLDNEMAGWLEDYLISYRGSFVMVTHDRYFLDHVSNRIVEISQGKLYSYQTNYSGFLALKTEREEMILASERKRQSILRKELEWIRRGARARSTKQKAHIQRYEELRDREGPAVTSSVEMASAASRLGRTTIELEDLAKGYGDRILFSDFTYIFGKNDRIGIVGPNGCGKTTLMRVIAGLEQPDRGRVTAGQTVKLGYFAQEVSEKGEGAEGKGSKTPEKDEGRQGETMDFSQRVIDYIRDRAEYVRTEDGLVSASKMLERFLFTSDMQYAPIGKLSGGERRRLRLLGILMEAPNVLILDEPTNDLDIETLTILEDYLDRFPGIVIAVSHDRYFLDRVVRRIFAFEDGRLVQYEGGYGDYLEKRPDPEEMTGAGAKDGAEGRQKRPGGLRSETGAGSGGGTGASGGGSPEESGRRRPRHQEKLRFTWQEERDRETIEDDIAGTEERIGALEEEMAACASDFVRLGTLSAEKEELEQKLEALMDRWMYLEEKAARIEEEQGAGLR